QPVEKLPGRGEHGSRVREFRKDDESDRQKRRATRDGLIDERHHAIGIGVHGRTVERIGEIGLARCGGVSDVCHGLLSGLAPSRAFARSSGGTGATTTRVLYSRRYWRNAGVSG